MPQLITRDGLKVLLAQLDRLVDAPVELLLVGGAAVLVHSTEGVATKDLDAFPTESLWRLQDALEAHSEEAPNVDLNTTSAGFETYLPQAWEERIQLSDEFSTQRIRVFTPSPEDLAVMKLFRYVAKDAEDIARLASGASFDPAAFRSRFLSTLPVAIGQPRVHAQSFALVWNALYPSEPATIESVLELAGIHQE